MGIQLEGLRHRLAERRIDLEVGESALAWLADQGYDPEFGARPLRRVIQKKLEDPLALLVLEGRLPEGSTARVALEGGALAIAPSV